MKIRTGFVSNSSTSSFIILGVNIVGKGDANAFLKNHCPEPWCYMDESMFMKVIDNKHDIRDVEFIYDRDPDILYLGYAMYNTNLNVKDLVELILEKHEAVEKVCRLISLADNPRLQAFSCYG